MADAGIEPLENIQKALKLLSPQEAEQVIADLRTQCLAMEIDPQEIYAVERQLRDGKFKLFYFGTGTFREIASEVNHHIA